MKKVLSLVLALAMVLGMSTMAFAVNGAMAKANDATVDYGNKVVVNFDVGTINPDQKNVTITITNNDMRAQGATFNALGGALNGTFVGVSPVLDQTLTAIFTNVRVTQNDGSKLVILADVKPDPSLEAFYLSPMILEDAAESTPGTADHNILTIRVSGKVVDKGTTSTVKPIPSDVKISGILPATKIDFSASNLYNLTGDVTRDHQLLTQYFEWTYTTGPYKGSIVTTSEVTSWDPLGLKASHLQNVGVRRTDNLNTNGTIKDVKISGTKVRIETIKYFTKCGSTEGSFNLNLTFESKSGGDVSTIAFKIANEKIELEENQEKVKTDGHVYVEAVDSVRDVEMDAGEGLYIYKSFGTGQKAFARVSLELSAGDEKLFTEFAELSDVYTLYTTNVASANVYVKFKDLDSTYFVYDEKFDLIGTTAADQKLPFSNKYYLTTAKVNLAGTGNVEESTAPESSTPSDIENAGTGGGTGSTNNYNPNTGA